jgi:hypothetical protein
MARKVNPSVYEAKANTVKELLGNENIVVKYAFDKSGEQHHTLQVVVPFTTAKDMSKQRNLATKAVRKAFPYRFDFESSNIGNSKPGMKDKIHRMKWVCYL